MYLDLFQGGKKIQGAVRQEEMRHTERHLRWRLSRRKWLKNPCGVVVCLGTVPHQRRVPPRWTMAQRECCPVAPMTAGNGDSERLSTVGLRIRRKFELPLKLKIQANRNTCVTDKLTEMCNRGYSPSGPVTLLQRLDAEEMGQPTQPRAPARVSQVP
jgi:hypothetical protein